MMKILSVIISAVIAVASFLSLFFDVEKKIPISAKTFILMVSIGALIVSWVDLAGGSEEGEIPDVSSDYIAAGTTQGTYWQPEYQPPDTYEPEQTESTTENVQANEMLVTVEPLAVHSYDISAAQAMEYAVPPATVETIYDAIATEEQCNQYEFIPQIDGVYRFEFSDVPDGFDLRLAIKNAGGETQKSAYDLDNGDGITVSLLAGVPYCISVEHYKNTGSYTLNIGCKKALVDASQYTKITDSVQYTNQENDYAFVPDVSGLYRFELSNVPDGTDLTMVLFNSGWEQIKSDYDLDNGDGITASLEVGHTYYVRIQQYENIGDYALNIGKKKPIQDISAFTAIHDCIEYTHQENDYLFTPATTGTYRFSFSDVPDGTDLKLYVLNSGWEQIKSDYDLDNGDGITIALDAQSSYYIRVAQYENVGSYTLDIGHKKHIVDISDAAGVADSIQYTAQENDYAFIPPATDEYRFAFSDVPDGIDLQLFVFNSGWERIAHDYELDNGDGITVSLEAGNTYYIRVAYYNKPGPYVLCWCEAGNT